MDSQNYPFGDLWSEYAASGYCREASRTVALGYLTGSFTAGFA